ncbi:MAG: hypothetical protein JWP02_3254 [Acidimicrobiales bacterium]|nr:hypothetical protein [Acidimicrobiales bacterium]
MLIFGTRVRASVVAHGMFGCPACRQMEPYAQRRYRRWFTVFFMPLVPLGAGSEAVECQVCQTKYRADVLSVVWP